MTSIIALAFALLPPVPQTPVNDPDCCVKVLQDSVTVLSAPVLTGSQVTEELVICPSDPSLDTTLTVITNTYEVSATEYVTTLNWTVCFGVSCFDTMDVIGPTTVVKYTTVEKYFEEDWKCPDCVCWEGQKNEYTEVSALYALPNTYEEEPCIFGQGIRKWEVARLAKNITVKTDVVVRSHGCSEDEKKACQDDFGPYPDSAPVVVVVSEFRTLVEDCSFSGTMQAPGLYPGERLSIPGLNLIAAERPWEPVRVSDLQQLDLRSASR